MDICTKSIRATREEILRFISTKQLLEYCSDDDSGSVNGFGDGSGYSGGEVVADDVHGSGYNYSSGYGYESCSGDGSGYGDGSGNCCGDGFGYIAGSGTGYIPTITFNEVPVMTNIKSINGNIVDYINDIPIIITHILDNFATGFIVKNDLILSPCFIAKVGESFTYGTTLKEAVTVAKLNNIKKILNIE